MNSKIDSYKTIAVAMVQNFIVFIFTYAITLLCFFMFDTPAEASTDTNPAVAPNAMSDALIHTVAATTITYCLSIILKNLFVARRTMYVTIISIGLSIVYVLLYVSSIHGVVEDIFFYGSTLVLLGFSLGSELEELFYTHSFENRKRYLKIFSA